MPKYIPFPSISEAAGNKPKIIREYVGLANTGTEHLSIAHMKSPSGWVEPGQRPEFAEYTVVLHGQLHVTDESGETAVVSAGEAIITYKGEWIQYSTPGAEGAEYIAVCIPAFSPDTVHRDGE
ncbi:MAG: cupin domain-containing protein [Candidatus Hydrogenedentes bacterium]|nr:cupin domain-containing protein [Candidatus Hydrogenedentota bacterium]